MPRIARDDPAVGRLGFQRIEVLRFAGEQVHDLAPAEEPARVALADELREIGSEQRAEDRVGLRGGERLDRRTCVDLAERRRLLRDDLHVGLPGLQQFAERVRGGLSVVVVRIDDRPALLLQPRRLGDQHGRLHVRRGAQPERVAVAVLPGELVGQRLGREEDELALLREVADGEAHVRRERAHEHRRLLAADQLFRDAHGVTGVAVVVARDHLELPAADAAGCVDFLEREHPALAVGLEEGGEGLVRIEFADADGRGVGGGIARREDRGTGRSEDQVASIHRCPSQRLMSAAFRPPMRAWIRGPSVITRMSTSSSGFGASATPTSIVSKWLRT